MSKAKSQYWQMIRGICILAVILIHCSSIVKYPIIDLDTKYYFVVRNMINFPVAVFFFISGKFYKPRGMRQTLHRVSYLLIPYLIYSTIYIIASMFFGAIYTFSQIIKMYICATASVPLYYIWVLVYYTLLTPFLHRYLGKRWLGILVVCSCLFPLIGAYIVEFNDISIWQYLKYTTIWLPFYYAGMLYQRSTIKIAQPKQVFFFVLVSFVLQLLECYILLRNEIYSLAYSQMRVSGLLYAWMIIWFICSFEKATNEPKVIKELTFIGDYSYGIYYLHSLFLTFLSRKLLDKFTVILIVERGAQLIFSLCMSLATIYVIKLIFKNKYSKIIFGV